MKMSSPRPAGDCDVFLDFLSSKRQRQGRMLRNDERCEAYQRDATAAVARPVIAPVGRSV